MSKKLFYIIQICVCMFTLSCNNKSGAGTDDQPTVVIGMVEYVPPEDNCGAYMFVVQCEDSDIRLYKPDNLPENFKIDKLLVKVTYRETAKKHNCGFGGDVPVIDVIRIEKLENKIQ